LQQNFLLQHRKKIFGVPNFVAVTKPFFSVQGMIVGFELYRKKCSKLNAIFKVVKA